MAAFLNDQRWISLRLYRKGRYSIRNILLYSFICRRINAHAVKYRILAFSKENKAVDMDVAARGSLKIVLNCSLPSCRNCLSCQKCRYQKNQIIKY
jgi:hypothetical protein